MAQLMIKKAQNGKSWYYKFETAPVDGKRKWESKQGFKTKGEAKAAGEEAYNLYHKQGIVVPKKSVSFHDLYNRYISTISNDFKPSTVDAYKSKAKNHILPYIGGREIKTITADDLRKLLYDLSVNGRRSCRDEATGIAKSSLNTIRCVLVAVFDYAVEEGLLTKSPAHKLKLPKENKTEDMVDDRTHAHVYITRDQISKLFELYPEGTYPHIPLMLGYRCGLRRGEAFGICWKDIDFENKTLQVQRQMQYSNTDRFWYFIEPKFASVRTIDLDNQIVELLKRERQRQLDSSAKHGEDFVRYYLTKKGNYWGVITQTPTKRPIDPVCIRLDNYNHGMAGSIVHPVAMNHLTPIIKREVMPDFDFHSLRHTHATDLIVAGASEFYVQRRLGHKSYSVTRDRYLHVNDDLRRNNVPILNDLYV